MLDTMEKGEKIFGDLSLQRKKKYSLCLEKILRKELIGEYTTKFTKADLKRSIDNITARNFERAWEKMNIIDYIKYVSKLRANAKNQIDTLSGDKLKGYVYEK